MNALPGMEAPAARDDALPMAIGHGAGGALRQPRPRNKMGRRPAWSEQEVLSAVQVLLEHPEGPSRGAEAISVWHQQLRDAFMGKFRHLAATSPIVAAREEVWVNRSARKIISEARSALNACRVLHRTRTKAESMDDAHANNNVNGNTGDAENGGTAAVPLTFPRVYEWLLKSTQELRRSSCVAQIPLGPGEAIDTDPVGVGPGAVGVDAESAAPVSVIVPPEKAAAAAIAAVAAADPHLPNANRENGSRRIKRPRISSALALHPAAHPAAAAPVATANIPTSAKVANLGNVGIEPAAVGQPMTTATETVKRKRREILDIETRRQMSELAALRDIFGPNSGAAASEVEEYKRLVRRNALRRAAMNVLDVNEGEVAGEGLAAWETAGAQMRGGRSSLSRIVG